MYLRVYIYIHISKSIYIYINIDISMYIYIDIYIVLGHFLILLLKTCIKWD